MLSSLGFHTMTLSMPVKKTDSAQLISDFQKYSQRTGAIQIYPDKHKSVVIKFYQNDRGIKWLIRSDIWMNGFEQFFDMVYVTINPKILSGVRDYITASNYTDMSVTADNFDFISRSISPLLGTFDSYKLVRVDYCVNFCLDELAPGCTPEQIMSLIKRADIPPHYREWMVYDNKAHRMKSKPGSFYLISKSANINCYSKYMKLQEQSRRNEERGYPSVSPQTMKAAQSIIRFEVQYKYRKTYTHSKRAEEAGNFDLNKCDDFLAPDACCNAISYYFNETIGEGDWYTLQEAVKKIQSWRFNRQKEQRLIEALQAVSQCRSLAKAKELHQGDALNAFKRTLKELSGLGINPVTIPKEWGIRHIPNLLEACRMKERDCRIAGEFEIQHPKQYQKMMIEHLKEIIG